MAVLTRLVLVAVLVTSGSVQGIRLNISPNPIVDGKTSTLSIRCDTDAGSTDNVYVIKITKPPSTTNLALVDSTGARVATSIQQRATATGSVSPAAGSSLTLTFTDAISCSDAGDYLCGYTSRITQLATVNQTVQAVSDPSNIEMVVRPYMVTYRANYTVELVCSGYIGKPVNGSWVWETRDVTSGSAWTPLRPGLTPVDKTPVSSGLCQMTGRSTLTFRVKTEDDKRMYRCYFRDSQHSGNFTFSVTGGVSFPSSSPPTANPPTANSSATNSSTANPCANAVDPSTIKMVVNPTSASYMVSDVVEMTCSKSVTHAPEDSWVWETRDHASGSTWSRRLPGLFAVRTHYSGCLTTGSITVQMVGEDGRRTFRCYLGDPQHSASFTFSVTVRHCGPR